MHFDAVFFDFDGTLVDSKEIKRHAFYELFPREQAYHQLISRVLNDYPDESRYFVIPKIVELIQQTKLELHKNNSELTLIERYSELVLNGTAEAPQIPNAYQVLNYLYSNGVSMYLCSNTPQSALDRLLQLRGWRFFFSKISGYPNTKEDFVAKMINEYDLDSSNVLVVGDGPSDRLAAERNGVKFYMISERFDLAKLIESVGVKAYL